MRGMGRTARRERRRKQRKRMMEAKRGSRDGIGWQAGRVVRAARRTLPITSMCQPCKEGQVIVMRDRVRGLR